MSDEEYDTHYVTAIMATDAYATNTEEHWRFGSKRSPRFPRYAKLDAQSAGVSLGFLIWAFRSKPQILLCSTHGPILCPHPEPALPYDITRWPSGTVLFQATGAEGPSPDPDPDGENTARFLKAVREVSAVQDRLAKWVGGSIAIAIAVHPGATYTMLKTLGGYGIGNWRLFGPWIWSLVCAAVLGFAITQQGLLESAQTLTSGPIGTLGWYLDAMQIAPALFVLLLLYTRLLVGTAYMHGTLLRAFNRQPIHGTTNLPDTGQSNILLKMLGHR